MTENPFLHKRVTFKSPSPKPATGATSAARVEEARKCQTRVVVIREQNGVWRELLGAPPFMFQNLKGFGTKLPSDHFMRGSKEHLERRAQVGLK